MEHKNDINNKNVNNNYTIETPHFLLSPKSRNSNYNGNIDDIKNNLNLLSLTLSKSNQAFKNIYSNKENFKDIINLKKKIISESSTLLHNERRMINLVNALNKMTIKNTNTISNNNNNNNNNNINVKQEEENDKNISISNSNISKSTSRKNKYFNFDRKIMLGNNEDYLTKKYPEPDDIDNNLVNVRNESNIIKNNSNIIKFDKKNENKSDYSNENLYFINNNKDKSTFNNNYYNKSNSFSMIKEIQKNINTNSSINKNYVNYMPDNNNFNINDITNINNTSIGEQISYLENNINKFEQNFGNQ